MGRARLGPNNTRLADDKEYWKQYMRDYYHEFFCKELWPVSCPLCGTPGTIQKLQRHQATKLCKKRSKQREEILAKIEEVMGKADNDKINTDNSIV